MGVVSFVGGARREVERLRVQDPGSSGWGTNRVGMGADDATRADANAAVSSAASEVEASDTETVREREEPLPQASRAEG
jgi:hypothetical protein